MIPTVLIGFVALLVFMISGIFILSEIESGGNVWLKVVAWFLSLAIVAGVPTNAYINRTYVEETKQVVFVDGKAVISEGEAIILLSKLTAESYKPGDRVTYKLYAARDAYFDFCTSWQGRIADLKTVRESE